MQFGVYGTSATGRIGEPVYPSHFEWQADKQEFVHAISGQIFQQEIFDDVDAMMNQENEMAWKGDMQIL